jgi:hypothetical protein
VRSSASSLVFEFESKFESLLDNPRDFCKRRFPTFHRALVLVTSWQYRVIACISVAWKFSADMVSMTVPGHECVPTFNLSAETRMSLIVAYSGSSLFTVIMCLLLTIGPWVYTGHIFSANAVRDDMQYGPCDIFAVSSFGYYRLLESQMRLSEEGDDGDAVDCSKQAPRESAWTARLLLVHVPRAYVLFWCVISGLDLLEMYAGTDTQGLGPCASPAQTLRYSWMQLWFIPGILCWSLPFIGVCVMLYGLSVGTSLVSYELLRWVDRFRCLKDARLNDLEEAALAERGGDGGGFIRKDAYERYFLLQRIVESSSKLWNVFLCVCLALTLVGGILFLAIICFSGAWLGGYSILAYVYLLLFISLFSLPIYLLSVANMPNSRFVQLFRWSIPPPASTATATAAADGDYHSGQRDRIPHPTKRGAGDYALIGGRDEWLHFLATAPIHWTVAGMPVTVEKLSAVLFSAALSVVLSTLPKIFAAARP